MQKILRNERGFTLIELLVVIAILGILMGVVVVGINPAERLYEARDARAQANVRQVAQALEACFTDNEGSLADCNTAAKLEDGYIVKVPSSVGVSSGCVEQVGRVVGTPAVTTTWYYSHTVGIVQSNTTGGC